MTPQSVDYRTDIQGMRGLAVLAVFAYHLWPDVCKAGFAGVDVFFVISGFIITRILLKEARSHGIRLAHFWARRIRRLLPAATLVLLACLALTVTAVPRTLWADTGRHILASSVYLQNLNLAALSVDYAGQRQPATIVQHYWSLSVEEQFYLLWPILAAAFALLARKLKFDPAWSLGLAAFSITLISFAAALEHPAGAYFLSTTRVWQLTLGCLLACTGTHRLPQFFRILASWAGAGLLAAAWFSIETTQGYPGWTALLPTSGAFLLIAAGDAGDWSWHSILSFGPIRFIGDISYSLYLWHWPVIHFLGDESITGLPVSVEACFVSVVLAVLTRFFVEDPLRIKGSAHSGRLWPSYLLGAALVAGVAVLSGCVIFEHEEQAKEAVQQIKRFEANDPDYPGAMARTQGTPRTLPMRPNPVFAREDLPSLYTDGCEAKQTNTAVPCEYSSGSFTLALVGDSHAAQYLPALELLAKAHGFRLLVFQKAACLLHPASIRVRATGLPRYDCDAWKKSALEQLLQIRPDAVVYTQATAEIYNEVYMAADEKTLASGYREILGQMLGAGIRVGVIRDNPRPLWDVPTCAYQNPACTFKRSAILDAREDTLFKTAGTLAEVSVLDLSDYYCAGDSCPAVVGNVLVYRDGDHITASFAKTLAPALDEWLLRWAVKKPDSAESR